MQKRRKLGIKKSLHYIKYYYKYHITYCKRLLLLLKLLIALTLTYKNVMYLIISRIIYT